MEQFVITGDNRLRGDVKVNGAKNAVLPILAACLLADGTCVLHNVPNLRDVSVMCELLRAYGAKITRGAGSITVDSTQIMGGEASADVIKKMRASNLVLGPMLSRFHQVRLPFPGGCAIGMRPMNYHLKALQALGADLREQGGFIEAYTTGLYGCSICLDFPSVGATENIMMAATLAHGTTVLSNAAREPEIVDLAEFLNQLGAKVKGAGSDVIVIEGVESLHGAEHTVMPDRIEAGTFLIAAAMTGGDIYCQINGGGRAHLAGWQWPAPAKQKKAESRGYTNHALFGLPYRFAAPIYGFDDNGKRQCRYFRKCIRKPF